MSKVFIITGSKSDFPVAEKAIKVLKKYGVAYDIAVASAHRTPARVEKLVTGSDADVFISVAGLSAALPGVIASFTVKPVIGVPASGALNYDALLSIVQMPPGIPVACVGMDRGDNAATLAVEILALSDPALAQKLKDDREAMAAKVEKAEMRLVPGDSALSNLRRVRASTDAAPARLLLDDKGVRALVAMLSDADVAAGTALVRRGRVLLGCADGALELVRVKPDGKREMEASAWAAGLRGKEFCWTEA